MWQGFTIALVPKDNVPRTPIDGMRVIALERVDAAVTAALG